MNLIELFAGVGGFRLGFENTNTKKDKFYKTLWSNQWEPSTKKQHASEVYQTRFGNIGHSNEDINNIEVKDIPKHDILCGGFPCQTFSIMRPKNKSEGLSGQKGDKGILFWEIHRILKGHNTDYTLLENVDRMLISPAPQKGKDFAVILKSLMDLGYAVEWRVINAAEYGFPQKRRRVFIFAYKLDSKIGKKVLQNKKEEDIQIKEILEKTSIMGESFPIKTTKEEEIKKVDLSMDIYDISEKFNKDNKEKNPFLNTGIAIGGMVWTVKTEAKYEGKKVLLKDILLKDSEIGEEFFADTPELYSKWEKAKGKIHKERINKMTGETYIFKGGAVPFPDKLNSPARTIITSEGGSSASRTTHIINPEGRLRRLHPIELERIQGFPDNHTKLEGISNPKRGFLLGNALVIGVVENIAKTIKKYND